MVARPFFVRKLVPVDQTTYAADPAGYLGEWASNPDGDVGEVLSENIFPVADPSAPNGTRLFPILGVIWSKTARPAMTYEDPTFMENVDDMIEDYINERVEQRLEDMNRDEGDEETDSKGNED